MYYILDFSRKLICNLFVPFPEDVAMEETSLQELSKYFKCIYFSCNKDNFIDTEVLFGENVLVDQQPLCCIPQKRSISTYTMICPDYKGEKL